MFRTRSEDFYERSFRLMSDSVLAHFPPDTVIVRKRAPFASRDLFYSQHRPLEDDCGARRGAAGGNMRLEALDIFRRPTRLCRASHEFMISAAASREKRPNRSCYMPFRGGVPLSTVHRDPAPAKVAPPWRAIQPPWLSIVPRRGRVFLSWRSVIL